MAKLTTCPFCRTSGSVRYIDEISTWTTARYVCSKCSHGIEVKTTIGKTAEVSSVLLTGVVLLKLLTDPTNIAPDEISDIFSGT